MTDKQKALEVLAHISAAFDNGFDLPRTIEGYTITWKCCWDFDTRYNAFIVDANGVEYEAELKEIAPDKFKTLRMSR